MSFEVIGNRIVFDEAVKKLLSKSSSASLYQQVHDSPTIIIVCVVDDPNPSNFGVIPDERGVRHPHINWNPGSGLNIFGPSSTIMRKKIAWVSGIKTEIEAWVGEGDTKDEFLMPEICLAHEIGHAKQYLDNPKQFDQPIDMTKIEANNLVLHEWPICRDFGLRQRLDYQHFRPPVKSG